MRKTGKYGMLFVFMLLAVCMLCGCRETGRQDVEKKTITFFASRNWVKEIDRQLFGRFEEETGIAVKLLLAPDDGYETLLGTCLTGGNSAVDIFMFPAGKSMEFAGLEQIALDLSQEEWVERMEDWALASVSCGGKVLGLNTWGEDYEGILYNRTYFRENGLSVPDTWEGFLTLCDKIRALGPTPLYEDPNVSWHIISWAAGLTPAMKRENREFCEALNRDPEYGFSDLKSFAKGLKQFRRLAAAEESGIPVYYTNGGQDEDFGASYRILTERQAVMIFTYSAFAAELKEYGSKDEWGMFPVPLLDNRTAISNGGGMAKFINKHSKNTAECRRLFDFLAEEENLKVYYGARTDLVTAAFRGIESAHTTDAAREILERSEETPCVIFTKETACVDPDLYKYMQGLSDGSMSVRQLIERCDAYRKEILEDEAE